jgi:hypothetical protein
MALELNPGFGFEELSDDELLAVDGGNSFLDFVAWVLGSYSSAVGFITYLAQTGNLNPYSALAILANNPLVQRSAVYAAGASIYLGAVSAIIP